MNKIEGVSVILADNGQTPTEIDTYHFEKRVVFFGDLVGRAFAANIAERLRKYIKPLYSTNVPKEKRHTLPVSIS